MKTPPHEYRRTIILSGLMSACIMLHFRKRLSARKSCCAYARTARMFSPTSLPKRLTTSRKFMLYAETSTRHSKETGMAATLVTQRPSKDGHGARRSVPGGPHASYPLDLIV